MFAFEGLQLELYVDCLIYDLGSKPAPNPGPPGVFLGVGTNHLEAVVVCILLCCTPRVCMLV